MLKISCELDKWLYVEKAVVYTYTNVFSDIMQYIREYNYWPSLRKIHRSTSQPGRSVMPNYIIRFIVVCTSKISLYHYNDVIMSERECVSNHQRLDCLHNHLFRCRSKKTSKLRVTGLCEGNSGPVTRKMFPFNDVIMMQVDRHSSYGFAAVIADAWIVMSWEHFRITGNLYQRCIPVTTKE